VVLVNLVGCVLLGALLGRGVDSRMRLLVGTGFCGGLTTFSTFAVDAAGLMRDSRAEVAATYLALSVVLGLGAFLAGRRLAGAGR
jgi:CrcB protein